MTDERQVVELLVSGGAFADLSFWRKVGVSGPEAAQWLNDLVSADVGGLAPGHAKRSLLLSPTGRIRAEFTAARRRNGFVLLQDPSQPASILDLLSPYTLSSHVELGDETDRLALFALPGVRELPQPPPGAERSVPSCLGAGTGLLAPGTSRDHLSAWLRERYAEAGGEAVEAWRILDGLPRVGVDALEDDLPQEAALEGAVAFGKGCYLGQEAVAKVRNLGHPRRLLLPLGADDRISSGDAILVNGRQAGEVTSAVAVDGRAVALGKVRWSEREGPFRTQLGVELRPRPVS